MNQSLMLALGIIFCTSPCCWGQAQKTIAFSFEPLHTQEIAVLYLVADVPDNEHPQKVWFKKDPGHVFIILERIDTFTQQKQALTWGFYPRHPISSIFFRKVKSELRDNGGHEYNASIQQQLSAEAFAALEQRAIALTQKKYHLNKYNCYDYALELFNGVVGKELLPSSKVKFPLVLGKGGSPCALYATLQTLQKQNIPMGAKAIHFGCFKAPESQLLPPSPQTLSAQQNP